jgi:16S rRNA processing protein RimM
VKKAEPPKPAAKAASKPVAKPKTEPVVAKKAEPKPVPAKPKAAAKLEPKPAAKTAPKAEAKTPTKPAAKSKAAPTPPKPEPVKEKADARSSKAAEKPKPEAKPEPAAKPAKAAKPPKPPKPEKPPKLAPVAAAFAGPIPSKPLAVAAGRAQPVMRTPITPMRVAPKPLAAPKPINPEPEQVGDLQPVPAFKAKAGSAKGMVLVGAIAGAFGVKGEVRLRAFTESKDGVIAYGPLYGEDGKVLLKPKSWRELKDGVAVVAPEVKTREDAEKLKGTRLFVPRANLPTPAEDEFYVVDLLGCRAEALDGQVLGEICAVWNFGAGDIIEYRPPNGGPNVRITFTKETAPLVDLAGKRVVLDPPAPEPLEK